MGQKKGNTFCHISSDEQEYIKNNGGRITDLEISEWIGCTRATVSRHRKALGLPCTRRKWNKIEMDTLKELWDQKKSTEDIGEYFGVSKISIRNIMVRMRYTFGYNMEIRSFHTGHKNHLAS